MAPNVWLDADSPNFWWQHECIPAVVDQLSDEEAEWYRQMWATPVLLPLGPGAWQVHQVEPLTLTPSILCGRCGVHGFFTDGVWRSV